MDFFALLREYGFPTTALALVLVGGLRGWYVFGWLYRDIVRDRDEWKHLALKGIYIAERAVTVADPSPRSPTIGA